jgi:hypothetical protein
VDCSITARSIRLPRFSSFKALSKPTPTAIKKKKHPHTRAPAPVLHSSRKRNFTPEVPNPAGRRVPSPSSFGPQWRRHRGRRRRAVPSSTPPTSARSFARPASPATSSLSSGSTPLYAKSQAHATIPPASLPVSKSQVLYIFFSA